MPMIEAALRGGAVTLLVFLAMLLMRDARRVPAAVLGTLYALGVAAYVVVSASIFAVAPSPWLQPLQLVAMGNPVLFWLFAATLFDDDFKPSWLHGLAWLGMSSLGMLCFWIGFAPAHLVFSAAALVGIALVIWYALAGRALDLVEERRRLRTVLIVSAALYSAVNIGSDILVPPGGGSAALYVANAFGLTVLTFIFAVAVLSVTPDGALISLPASATTAPALASSPRGDLPPMRVVTPRADEDAPLLAALRNLMEKDKAYREEGLSIASLAGKLGLPEYRLRRLINQRLGYRNFAAFLNGYRLGDVMAALADPGQGEVPILTIALDAGFQSIGPFNRAFKAQTGMTPSEFRRMELGHTERIAAE